MASTPKPVRNGIALGNKAAKAWDKKEATERSKEVSSTGAKKLPVSKSAPAKKAPKSSGSTGVRPAKGVK